MDQAYPDIAPEIKERMHEQGLKPYKMKPIPDFFNPHKGLCICVELCRLENKLLIDWSSYFLSLQSRSGLVIALRLEYSDRSNSILCCLFNW
jgi:hypothetical protein